MSKTSIVALIVIGALIGAGSHYLKANIDATEQTMRDQPGASYRACEELNQLKRKFDPEAELTDCASEYLK